MSNLSPTPPPLRNRPALDCLLPPLLLFLLVFGLFSPSIRYGYVHLDDSVYVKDNPLVLSGLSLRGVRNAFATPPSAPGISMYLPMVLLSYMADVSLFGASASNPAPFHAVNVVLHAVDTVLFYLILLRLPSCRRFPGSPRPVRRLASFLLALLWAVHPLRVESVAWITERKDVLSLFFALLSLLAYLRAAATPRPAGRPHPRLFFAFSVLAFAAALLSKPTLVPFPLLLVAVDLLACARPLSWRLLLGKTPFFLLSAAAILATLWGHRLYHPTIPLAARVAHVPPTLAHYLHLTLCPRHLSVLDPDPVYALLPTLFDALLLAALLFLAFRLRRRAPLASLGILWFFLSLVPVSGLSAIPNTPFADRFSYVPALGLSVALVPLLGGPAAATPRIRHVATALLALALLGFSALSLRILPHWRDGDALYARARLFAPRHTIILSADFARAFVSGDFPAARAIAADAMSAHPDAPQFAVFFAKALANTDGPAPAIDFLSARRPPPGQFLGEWAWEMAALSLRLGRPDDALAFAALSESELPASSGLRGNIALLRDAATSGDPVAALPYYIAQWRVYERADALEFFRRLVAVHPSRPDILANVAWTLATADWSPAPPSEALDLARRAIGLVPTQPPPELLDTLAAALANASDFPSAVAAQERAIALLPPLSPSLPDYQTRLALYRQSTPYRRDIGIDW